MKIKVKAFGRYKDILGRSEMELDMASGNTIWHVIDYLVKRYPKLEKEKKFILISLNNTYTTSEAKIKSGDVITFSPPIVGGG